MNKIYIIVILLTACLSCRQYDVDDAISETFSEEKVPVSNWCENSKANTHINELYINSEYVQGSVFITALEVRDGGIRLFISDENGNRVAWAKEYSTTFTKDYYKYNSFTPVLNEANEIIGWVQFNYKDDGYGVSGVKYEINNDVVSDIDNNPQIKQILNNQIVLLGDSKFGLYWANCLPDMLSGLTGCVVYNCGFGGCRMGWCTPDGSNDFDVYSFPSLCDAIISGDFTKQIEKKSISTYDFQINNLQKIDLTKPTTIIVNYNTNDIIASTLLGDTSCVDKDIQNLNRNRFADAIVYGVKRCTQVYPDVKFIFLSPDYRITDEGPVDQYTNEIGKCIWDYYDMEKIICAKLGVDYYDSYYLEFRNPRNINDYTTDGTHFNGAGFSKYAKFLCNIYKNDI